jgi:hypothetical protein
MTTKLQALKTLIEEYRRAGQTLTGSTIADCMVDPTPLSQAVLEGMGWVAGDTAGMLFCDGIGVNRILAFLFDEGIQIHLDGKRLHPQPRTVGHLYQLLLRLSEDQQ